MTLIMTNYHGNCLLMNVGSVRLNDLKLEVELISHNDFQEYNRDGFANITNVSMTYARPTITELDH